MNDISVAPPREHFPGTLTHWQLDGQELLCTCDNQVLLSVQVLTERLLRFRFSVRGFFPKDFSYAIDPAFAPAKVDFEVREDDEYLYLSTSFVVCRLKKEGLTTTLTDKAGKVLLDDEKGFHWEASDFGGEIVMMSKIAQEEESYFGLGDKAAPFNLRGHRFTNWVTDSFGYHTGSDPLYRAIPFYMGLVEGDAYGVFFDNSFRTSFDFASERNEATSYWAQGGEMNYYFFYGPDLLTVSEEYAQLTGRPELPPMWSLGFQQCKWSYYPESNVKEIAQEFRDRQIPCDAIYLDIDYMDGYRCFTWNNEHFPDPARMIRELKEQGFRTVVMIDPGIKIDHNYWVFKEGVERDAFLKRPDGPFAEGNVWPGPCYFPDFTKPEVREWWGGLYKDLIRKMEVDGVWNDMNEPAVFEVESKTLPLDVRFHYEGHPSSHRRGHNIYGMQMSRASFEGVKNFSYPKRPILITRATYSGGQRYASVWTGDNVANWEHLWLASVQCQRLSVSGFSFAGSDIGGFNDMPDGELFTRWIQLGIFHPLCRVHSIGYNDVGDAAVDDEAVAANQAQSNRDQEPWSFGEPYTEAVREAIELRYRLLPVMYTAFWQYVQRGTPMLRPLSFLDQRDSETLHRMEEFTLGDHLLVAPVSEQGAKKRGLYLPKGLWYDFNTSKPIPGGQEIMSKVGLGDIPMYVRGGGIIPMAPVMQYTGERPIDQMELRAYVAPGSTQTELYLDAGDGYDYEEDGYRHAAFTMEVGPRSFELTQKVEGSYKVDFPQYKLVLHGLDFKASRCSVDGKNVSFLRRKKVLEVYLPADFERFEVL